MDAIKTGSSILYPYISWEPLYNIDSRENMSTRSLI